jgi:hypothetical protein
MKGLGMTKDYLRDQDSVEIYTVSNEVELAMIEEALTQHKIPFMFRSFEEFALDGLYTKAYGLARVVVLKNDEQRARRILERTLQKKQQEE